MPSNGHGVTKTYWICVVPGCLARLVLHEQTVKNSPNHNHDEQRAEILVHRSKKMMTLRPTLPADMDAFTSYFESTWMGTPNRPARFDRLSWNQYDCCLAGLPRSSNLAEGWHNGFRSLVQCSNPTIWKFLEALKLEQGLTDQKITERLMRRPPPQRAAKWIRYDSLLESFMQAYDNQEYEVIDYLSAVSAAL